MFFYSWAYLYLISYINHTRVLSIWLLFSKEQVSGVGDKVMHIKSWTNENPASYSFSGGEQPVGNQVMGKESCVESQGWVRGSRQLFASSVPGLGLSVHYLILTTTLLCYEGSTDVPILQRGVDSLKAMQLVGKWKVKFLTLLLDLGPLTSALIFALFLLGCGVWHGHELGGLHDLMKSCWQLFLVIKKHCIKKHLPGAAGLWFLPDGTDCENDQVSWLGVTNQSN